MSCFQPTHTSRVHTLFLLVTLCGCHDAVAPGPPSVTPAATGHLFVTQTALVLARSDTGRLGVVLEDGASRYELPEVAYRWRAGTPVTWQSTAPAVLEVDTAGLLTARAPGTAWIRVRAAGLVDSAAVRVGASDGRVGAPFMVLSAGGNHTCALDVGGQLYCWGSNWFGQLGTGTAVRYTATVSPIPGATAQRFREVATGATFSCGLATDGGLLCWGALDRSAARGAATDANGAAVPGPFSGDLTPVPTRLVAPGALYGLSAGTDHACALDAAGGAYCWGGNDFGQLGTATVGGAKGVPVPVRGGRTYRQIAAGASHTCALTTDGAAYCWGDNTRGQLGSGVAGSSADAVAVAGARKFATIAAGGFHTCATTPNGAAYCWGANDVGQLGTGASGSGVTEPSPVAVVGGLTFQNIKAGIDYTCGLTTDDHGFCWGQDALGQLGIGAPVGVPVGPNTSDAASRNRPTEVAGGYAFTDFSAGAKHVCARTTTGAAYCWGADPAGQLGAGRHLYAAGVAYAVLTPLSSRPWPVAGD